jgi:hypothetical protein
MGLRRLYHLLMNSERKPKQPPQSQKPEASLSEPHTSTAHSKYSVADTCQAETTSPHATDESPPHQEPMPSNISKGKQRERPSTPPPDVRSNRRRYGQISHNPDVEAIGMRSSEDSTPTTNPTESTKALFPPLPPFRMRKRSCGGA